MQSNEIVTQNQVKPGKGFMIIESLQQAKEVATLMIESGMVADFHLKTKNPVASVVMCLQRGMEVGLPVTQSVQDLANIGGRVVIWGDAALALCKVSPDYEYCVETFNKETETAMCRTKRKGEEENIVEFSAVDAKNAGLLEKPIYKQYRKVMLQRRARGFGLRATFPHVLKGLHLAEEYVGVKDEVEINPIDKTVHIQEKEISPEVKKHPLDSIKARLRLNESKEKEGCIDYSTFSEMIKLIAICKIPSDVVQKWIEKAKAFDPSVKDLSDLSEEQGLAIIEKLKKDKDQVFLDKLNTMSEPEGEKDE